MPGLFDDLVPQQSSGGLFDDIPAWTNVKAGSAAPASFGNVSGDAQQAAPDDAPIGDQAPDWGSTPQSEANALNSSGAMDKIGNSVANLPAAGYEGLGIASTGLGKYAGLAAAGPLSLFDDIAGTHSADTVFKNMVAPYDAAEGAYKEQLAQKDTAGQILGGVTAGAADLTLAAMSGGETVAPRLMAEIPSAAKALANSIAQAVTPAVKMSAPLAEKAAADTYAQTIANGGDWFDATGEALKAIGSTMAMAAAVPGEGPLLQRIVQGGGSAGAVSESLRSLEGREFNPVELGTSIATGAGFGLAGHEAPREVARDVNGEPVPVDATRIEPTAAPEQPVAPEAQPTAEGAPEKPRGRYNHATGKVEGLFDDLVPEKANAQEGPQKALQGAPEASPRDGSSLPPEASQIDAQSVPEASKETVRDTPETHEHVPEIEGFEDLVPDAPLKDAAKPAPAENAPSVERASPGPADILELSKQANVPLRVMREYHEGTLTTGKLLDSIVNNEGQKYTEAKQFRALAGYLKDVGTRLGGLDTPINRFSEALHGDDVKVQPGLGADKAAGYYKPGVDAIRVHSDAPNMHLLLHESVHALTTRQLLNGERGSLSGEPARSFATLSNVFDAINAHDKAGKIGKQSYGFTNVHEMMAEFFSNGVFRKELKNIKLSDVPSQGFGRLALSKVRNMYDAVVGSVRGMLNMPEKAETALDALFAASHKFLGDVSPADRLIGPERGQLFNSPAMEKSGPTRQEIEDRAKVALARGADPKAVYARTQELLAKHNVDRSQETTGGKNAVVDAERHWKGLDEISYEGRRSDSAAWDSAAEKLKANPDYGKDLAASLAAKGRPPTAEEQAVLIQDRMRIANDSNQAYSDLMKAMDSKHETDEEMARIRIKTLDTQAELNDRANKASGNESSAALRMRRYLAKADYTMTSVAAKARAAFGKAIPEEVHRQLSEATSRIEELTNKIDALEKKSISSRANRVPMKTRMDAESKFKDLSVKLKKIKEHLNCATG